MGNNNTETIVIYGAGGHAKVIADILRLTEQYEIIGFLDDNNPQKYGNDFYGSYIIGGKEKLNLIKKNGTVNIIIGFGNNYIRLRLGGMLKKIGFNLVSAIHPTSILARDISIGPGTVVAAGVIINPESHIGENVIINTNVTIDHECNIQDGVHISPGVIIAGNVNVGKGSWIGVGAIISDHIIIGSGSIIGAGAVVVNNIPNDVVAYGFPAKPIRRVETNDW